MRNIFFIPFFKSMKILQLATIFIFYSVWIVKRYHSLGIVSLMLPEEYKFYIKNQKYFLILSRLFVIAFIATFLYIYLYTFISTILFATGLLLCTPILSIGTYHETIRDDCHYYQGDGFFKNLVPEECIWPEIISRYFWIRTAMWALGFILVIKSIIK